MEQVILLETENIYIGENITVNNVTHIDITVELPAIRESFEELKYLLLAKEPGLENRLKE
ncbi:MAG: hypothetical protein GY757_18300, partial [bacterium]|nr:hypothetical protein [bacterium]